ncbi:hypothetical protein [Psychroserpens sp.]|uniref:hypothetical protein n=1 Tax=Psychroserpens sp. TaxID=2020870 RepID=UPI00122C04C5|nr:hypothetical protein [Psychroserpens sp.]RZN83330.1 MAG: hypothetical protein EVB11_05075 [Winogradskyella sp.]MBO6605825.1 hypothetical protein [Psychroserpens sp.]MBO6630462.1 hypothetical protein [Psychroserpens sp.]MBO6652804.1 hypothetical protein [Psychroserpens sp.]MBO6681424.1 hypothetical protein [Psychroserpens sp.]
MEVLKEVQEFLNIKMNGVSASDRIQLSRNAKRIVLIINEIYKKNKDPELMELMKGLTIKKKRIDVRSKGRPTG